MGTYKDNSFSLVKVDVDASNQVSVMIQSNLIDLDQLTISLIGLDRKYKIELTRSSLEANSASDEYVGLISNLTVEPIQPNEISIIDFYVEIRDTAGTTIHKRLVSELDHHEDILISDTFTMGPYQTKFNNYSWKIIR